MTGGRTRERPGLLRYCWMNGPPGRRGMGWRGVKENDWDRGEKGKQEKETTGGGKEARLGM